MTKARGELIDALLTQHGTPHGTDLASAHPCQGTKHHSPAPLTTAHFEPYPVRAIWLCPTCQDKLQCLLLLYAVAPEQLTWQVRQQFGNTIRMLGEEYAKWAQESGDE